mmetsp:Transcript_33774/g.111713  ORF Transcript_33774/g.111713 Transcript_33774/m.111713 type:complete len:267 (-) Transcript_33774:425-1225(-)
MRQASRRVPLLARSDAVCAEAPERVWSAEEEAVRQKDPVRRHERRGRRRGVAGGGRRRGAARQEQAERSGDAERELRQAERREGRVDARFGGVLLEGSVSDAAEASHLRGEAEQGPPCGEDGVVERRAREGVLQRRLCREASLREHRPRRGSDWHVAHLAQPRLVRHLVAAARQRRMADGGAHACRVPLLRVRRLSLVREDRLADLCVQPRVGPAPARLCRVQPKGVALVLPGLHLDAEHLRAAKQVAHSHLGVHRPLARRGVDSG